MEEGGTNNGQPTVDCADRINKFEEQKPSRVNAEIEKKSSHSKGQVGAEEKVDETRHPNRLRWHRYAVGLVIVT